MPGAIEAEHGGDAVTGVWSGSAYVFPFGVIAPSHLRPGRSIDGRRVFAVAGQSLGAAPSGARLLAAAAKMPDAALSRDLASLTAAAACDADRSAIRAYGRLRRRARGFRPGDYGHNSHALIDRAVLATVAGPAAVRTGRSATCATCGTTFSAQRSSARYCSGRCRERARRNRAA
ncbi:hypothetical protein [Litorihabitans aurantiacus]|nr:hypothetical protein [Litorihabitans aurantiacus]